MRIRSSHFTVSQQMSVEAKAKYHGKVLQVAVPSPLRRVFDYLPLPQQQASPEPQAGIRVKVSFGRQQLIGIVVAVANSSILEKKKLKRLYVNSAQCFQIKLPLKSKTIIKP